MLTQQASAPRMRRPGANGHAVSHPYQNQDSAFERFAERASNFTSRWLFFVLMLLLASASIRADATERARLEHVIVGVLTITSLFKISLLANAEKLASPRGAAGRARTA